jgi:hypothetical protein
MPEKLRLEVGLGDDGVVGGQRELAWQQRLWI